MELRQLIDAVLAGDLLTARQWVADARRQNLSWSELTQPCDFDALRMTVAAGLVEMLAQRAGEAPPPWTATVGPEDDPVLLDPGLDQMPRSLAVAKLAGPEPLRKRNLVAMPDFLEVA